MGDPASSSSLTGAGSADDLLVFGYSCKLFRDDERAEYVDRGGHLIPWMGDASLPIDRYDGRGVLSDLKGHEGRNTALNDNGWMTPEERTIEAMCDEERYRAMQEDDLAHAARLEEERKRGNKAEIGFSYDQPQQQPQQQQQQQVEQPSLRTLANCIEKTAEFICSQGAQMEILMRAKETENPKFQFLNPGNPYHAIYKQVLEKKRSRPKGYNPVVSEMAKRQASLELEKSLQELTRTLRNAAPDVVDPDSSLQSSSSSEPTNAYSALVKRIRVNQMPARRPTPPSEPKTSTPPPPPPPPQEPVQAEDSSEHTLMVTPPPITMQPIIDKTASYVARKGTVGNDRDVVQVLRKHDPDRFAFLNPENEYNAFYRYKVVLYQEMLAEAGIPAPQPDKPNGDQQTVRRQVPNLKGFFR